MSNNDMNIRMEFIEARAMIYTNPPEILRTPYAIEKLDDTSLWKMIESQRSWLAEAISHGIDIRPHHEAYVIATSRMADMREALYRLHFPESWRAELDARAEALAAERAVWYGVPIESTRKITDAPCRIEGAAWDIDGPVYTGELLVRNEQLIESKHGTANYDDKSGMWRVHLMHVEGSRLLEREQAERLLLVGDPDNAAEIK